MSINLLNNIKSFGSSLGEIYSTKNDEAKGRLITLGSTLMASFYNIFITGIFYTGFLTMYGIDITGAGIVAFIPFIASCFSFFSSSILERIKKRKAILLTAKIVYYALYIVATTLMPQFVFDPQERLIWFVIILFVSHSIYALFSPGITTWFYRFYPENNETRTRFLVLNQVFSSIASSCILLLSGFITDAVEGSPIQDQLIIGLRYFAFVLVIIDVLMQACAKEYPYPKTEKPKLLDVFTLPFKYRKFILCMAIMFMWSFINNLNNGLWIYHIRNHLNFSYTLINLISVMYTVILLCTNSLWKKVLRRYSWIKTFGIAMLIYAPTEFVMFTIRINTTYLYMPTAFVQNLVCVGLNLAYSNILYMNLPNENTTAHIAFNTIGCNLFSFLGMITGTFISSISGDSTIRFLGMDIYTVQFTTVSRAFFMVITGILLVIFWRSFTKEKDIKEIEERAALRKAERNNRHHGISA